MTNLIADLSQQKAARVAGFAWLVIILTSILSLIFVESKLVVEGNVPETVNNIISNELLFRIGAAYELIMFPSVVILSLALYVILKPVSKNLALLALLWRLGEAILGSVAVLSSLTVLLLLNGESYPAVFETEQLQALVGLFLDVRSAALSIVLVFLSLGSIVFSYLFFTSKYIPRILAVFGIFSFLLMLIGVIVNILSPNDALKALAAPAILFEVLIGLWLLFKGISVKSFKSS